MPEIEGIPFSVKMFKNQLFPLPSSSLYTLSRVFILLEFLWWRLPQMSKLPNLVDIEILVLISASFDTTLPLAFVASNCTFYTSISQDPDLGFLLNFVFLSCCNHMHRHNFSYPLYSHSLALCFFFLRSERERESVKPLSNFICLLHSSISMFP